MMRSQRVWRRASAESLILIVDPDAGDRWFMEKAVRRGGFRSRSVAGGEEAIAAARAQRPELVVLEVCLGERSGYEICKRLRDEYGNALAIMFVSAERAELHDRVAGLLLGADDFLAKPLAADELVARVSALVRRAGQEHTNVAPRSALTARELEILQMLAQGLDQASIAAELVIAPRTVAKHIENILRKLPAHSRAEAVAIAYQRGLQSPAPVAATA